MDLIDFSISPEVYVIVTIIGIGTYFILRRMLGKIIKTDRTLRIIATWLGTITLAPIIYVGLVVSILIAMTYEPARDFDREKWFADKAKRYEMRDDLVKSDLLKNKSKKQILNMLGTPDFGTDTTNVWNYDLGVSAAGLGWQFNALEITFEHDHVTKVEKNEVID